MVSFHFSFDLNNFHVVSLDLKHGEFWRDFRIVIVSMFVFLAGISLQLAHRDSFNIGKVKKRILVLGSASLLVSIGSYTQFPNTWIYFGILHFFLFASIVGLFFLRVPRIAIVVGSVIIITHYFGWINMHWLYNAVKHPLSLPLYYTEDLANIFPWFGLFLLGMASVHYNVHTLLFQRDIFLKDALLVRILSWSGRKSLWIYMLHQPILFLIFSILIH